MVATITPEQWRDLPPNISAVVDFGVAEVEPGLFVHLTAKVGTMTTAAESHDAQLAAIKARHEAVRAKFADPEVTLIDGDIIDLAVVNAAGVVSAYLDTLGRFWTITLEGEPRRIVARMVFDPHGPSRGRDDFDLQDHVGLVSPHARDESRAEGTGI